MVLFKQQFVVELRQLNLNSVQYDQIPWNLRACRHSVFLLRVDDRSEHFEYEQLYLG